MNENDNVKRRNMKKKKNKKKKIILFSILGVLLLAAAIVGGYYYYIRGQIYVESKPNPTKEVTYDEVDGITNVLLIGTDGRTLDEPARSDSIIIATLDNNNKKVKLTSIMRDTVVEIPEYGEDKINAAFAYGSINEDENGKMRGAEGGASLLMETIENNFGLHLDKYIIVNFWGFEAIIDEIGGIEADIKDYEIEEVNKYIGEATGVNSPPITETGLQTLNGQQALSYARIRYVGNGNFERGERQSKVLLQIATKLKEVNPIKYVSIANALAKEVKTNIDIPEALNLAYTIYKLPTLEFEQLQIPQAELIARDYYYKDKGWCLLIDLEQHSQIMHDFIFNNITPNPDEFDLISLANTKARYEDKEARYNALYNIKPEEHDDRNSDNTTVTPPKKENNNSNGTTGSGEQKPPAEEGNDKKPPANGGNEQKPPADGGNEQTPPANGGNEQKPPADGGNNQTPPANIGNEQTPPSTQQ
ncbi:transcriptional regulator [Clostridium sartagoforme]|uniref:Transcriptional regulator n=1 Tax=Clostridium sartagoforme TaxID=84031 RepID=A0A4S2DQD6_9CLOT|nr:LCP family protein [Clostridium sartagoforme]TGY43364.1 transcriptional regulator [Clostridium sartagoforme]